jgi:hypothetical protein
MRRLLGRALLLFAAYTGLLLAMVIAGYLSAAIGIWAAALWGIALIAVGAGLVRHRLASGSTLE